MVSTIFLSAAVIDGSEHAVPYIADVLVSNGEISKIGPPGTVKHDGARVIDATGYHLAPGFIDMHAHSDLYLLTHPTHEAKITQGCTTEVVGQDGISYAPVRNEQQMQAVRSQIAGWNGNPTDQECKTELKGIGMFEWRTLGEYLDCLDRNKTATNVAALVPQGNLRLLACGPYDKPATNEEITDQIELLRQAMNEGAVGMSSGLTYTPGMYASTSELARLCKVLAEDYPGAFYAPHHRSYGHRALESYHEMLELGDQTRCPIHLTHATMNFSENRSKAPVLLSLIDTYIHTKHCDITLDTYPYLPGCTTLAALLPSWTSSGGSDSILTHLRNFDSRARIQHAVEVTGCDGGHGIPTDWSEIQVGQITHDASIAHYSGRFIAEIASAEQQSAIDIFFEIMLKDNLATNCLMHVGHEDNVQAIMQHATHMAGSDAILHGEKVHPRAYGTMTRYLGHYARDAKIIPLAKMVAHLTSRPARRIGIYPYRACIREGSAADLVLFDAAMVKDMATFEEPKLPSQGVRFVMVNGELALDEGKVTGCRAGRTLRRKRDGSVG